MELWSSDATSAKPNGDQEPRQRWNPLILFSFESLVFIMSDNVFSLTEGLYNTRGSLTCGFVIGCYGSPPQESHPACQVGLDV